ncbi:MAG: PKD domain-containing protein, partial [Bacteroidia bacterium]
QGVGGINLPLTTNLLYMGAGGGGGFRDNGQSCTAGGAGGAIVFIISSQINGNNRVICTAGVDVTVNSVDEGAGGGGAGGSVYISCPAAGYIGNLTVDVRGGKGGSNFNSTFPSDCHGPGGGGGGGVYAYTGGTMPAPVSFLNAGGVSGLVLNPASSCFNTGWGAQAGSPGISLNNLTIAVAVPTVSIAGTNTVCSGSTVTLTASGAGSYTWSTGAMTSTAAVTPTTLTTYTVTGGLATCTNSATFSVTPVNTPTLTVAGNFSICAGNPTTLTASGATTYTWNTGANTSSIAPSATATTVYTVSGTASTCSASATATLTVTPSPTPVISSNSPVCVGNPINLNGNGGVTYQWTGPSGSGFSSSQQNPSIGISNASYNGTFTLTVTDINNCSASATQAVVVNALPMIGTTGSTVCVNQAINLGANGGTSYTWIGPAGYSSAIQNPVIANASLGMTGIYTVTVTDANTCTNTAVASVSVNPIPTPSVQSNSPVCVNKILSLNAAGGVSYQWSGPSGFSSSVQNPTLIATGAAQSGIYAVTVSDPIGCAATATMNVSIIPAPSLSITSGPNKGCAPLCLTFTCASTSSVQTYAWDFGDGNGANSPVIKHCFKTPGIYTVTAGITDTNNCYNAATFTVNSYPKPTADFNFSPIKPILNEGPVNFSDASYGANINFWSWYFMNTASYQSSVQNPSFVYGEAGTYQVALVVKSDKGCRDTIIKTVTVSEDFGIFVPDAFTPNGDGLNDLFQAKGFGISKYDLEIYDRWGEKLFHTTDFTSGWNGTYNNKPVTEGVYVWKIKVTSIFGKSETLTGHVTLFK